MHKSFLKRLIRDDRLSPNNRFLAELLLLYVDDVYPQPMIESIILEQYGRPNLIKRANSEMTVADAVDRNAVNELKDQWRSVFPTEENDKNASSTN